MNEVFNFKQEGISFLGGGLVQNKDLVAAMKLAPYLIVADGAADIAIKNNVTGWVRNLDDGRVEILIEGDDRCIDSVIAWCDCGPANSRVDDIQINNENYLGSFENFEVRY